MSDREKEPYKIRAKAANDSYNQLYGTKRNKRKSDTANKPNIVKVRKATAARKKKAEKAGLAVADESSIKLPESEEKGLEEDEVEVLPSPKKKARKTRAASKKKKAVPKMKKKGKASKASKAPRRDAASTHEFGKTHNLVQEEDASDKGEQVSSGAEDEAMEAVAMEDE